MRRWDIRIPIRPKCVQSIRMGRSGAFVDKKTKEWKRAVEAQLKSRFSGTVPSKAPIQIDSISYIFRCPVSANKKAHALVNNNEQIPYLGKADVTDNLNKGLIDVCKGIIFEDDSQIWRIGNIEKLYGAEDCIELHMSETPDVFLISGKKYCDVIENEVQNDAAASYSPAPAS